MTPAVFAIARTQLRVLRRDPGGALTVVIVPLLVITLMRPLYDLALEGRATAAVVVGTAVTFTSFTAGFSGFSYLRDEQWGTWPRLLASPATAADLLVAKSLTSIAILIAQLVSLFAVAGAFFGFRVDRVGLFVLSVGVYSAMLVAFGTAVTALARTEEQLSAVANLGGVALALFGGAFIPYELLPGWAQAIAPTVPTYWAVEALGSAATRGTTGRWLLATTTMSGFILVFSAVAVSGMRRRFHR